MAPEDHPGGQVNGCAPTIDLPFLEASSPRALVYVEVAHFSSGLHVDLDIGMRPPPFDLNTAIEWGNSEGPHSVTCQHAELPTDEQGEVAGSGDSRRRRGISTVGVPTLRQRCHLLQSMKRRLEKLLQAIIH